MAIIESKGKGYSLFNGVKLASLPEWDKAAYPYVVVYWVTEGTTANLLVSPVPYSYSATYNNGANEFAAVFVPKKTNKMIFQFKSGEMSWTYKTTTTSSILGEVITLDTHPLVWSNHDIINTADNSVYFAASEPISLDGMNVIEWDGDTEGLELFAGTTNFWRVSNAVDVDTEKGFVEAHINEMHGTISGNVKAPLTEKEGYWELLPIRYVPAASEAYPTTGVYFIETKLMQPRLFAYYPIEPAEPEQPEIDRGKLFLLYRIFSPDVFYAITGKKHWSE